MLTRARLRVAVLLCTFLLLFHLPHSFFSLADPLLLAPYSCRIVEYRCLLSIIPTLTAQRCVLTCGLVTIRNACPLFMRSYRFSDLQTILSKSPRMACVKLFSTVSKRGVVDEEFLCERILRVGRTSMPE